MSQVYDQPRYSYQVMKRLLVHVDMYAKDDMSIKRLARESFGDDKAKLFDSNQDVYKFIRSLSFRDSDLLKAMQRDADFEESYLRFMIDDVIPPNNDSFRARLQRSKAGYAVYEALMIANSPRQIVILICYSKS